MPLEMLRDPTQSPEERDGAPGRAPKFPPQRFFDFPADVANRYALAEMLRETDVFGHAVAEAEGYLKDALERIRITMAIIPSLPPDASVLELRVDPWVEEESMVAAVPRHVDEAD